MKDLTVLITAAGNVFMPGTTACLRNNGERRIRIVGADMSDDASIRRMCDAAYPVPRGTDPDYADALLEICRNEGVDVLLPIMSVELEALARNRERFEAVGTKVSVSDLSGLTMANNKRLLLEHMTKHDFPCADFRAVNSLEELSAAVEALGYPEKKVCVKAAGGSGSRGFRILSEFCSRFDAFLHDKPTSGVITLKELREILAEAPEFPELIAMEYLPGREYSVDLLADKGKTLYSGCRKSLRMENSIMLEAEIVHDPRVTDLCESVTASLGLDGNIGFDVKEREDGTPLIMECNPRITAGIPFFSLAGVNLPYLCVKKLLGEPLPLVQPEYGKIIRRRWQEMTE